MKVIYDPEVDALYVRLTDEPAEVTTQRLSEEVAVNYAPDGRIVGVEILDASDYVFGRDALREVALQNLTPVME